MAHAPVLIVGAGPTGLAAAVALAQSGIPIRIIDKLEQPANQSRAAAMHARTVEMFERLGIADRFLDIGVRVRGAQIYGSDDKLLIHPNLESLDTPFPFLLGIGQNTTERLLTERLAELGVKIERGIELLGFTQSPSAVAVRMSPLNGSPSIEEFSYVIGADGAHGATRGALGLHLEGETLDATWITADVKIRWDRKSDEAFAFLATDGLAFLLPMNGDRWRVIVNLHNLTKEEAEKFTIEDVEKIVCERFGQQTPLYDAVWISPFSLNTRMTPTMRVGRVFLAGDASHIHSPVGGQGMNTGIQDGLNLAWKLALVLQGVATPELLDSYDPERHENAKRLLRSVGPATKMINLQQPVATEIRNLVMRLAGHLGVSHIVAKNFSMLEIAYPDSPIAKEARGRWLEQGPHAGHRAPDARGLVVEGSAPQRLFTIWEGDPRHQLLLFAGKSHDASALQAAAAQFADYGKFLRVLRISADAGCDGAIVDSKGDAHKHYGVDSPSAFLVRPDGYIATRAPLSETAFVHDYIDRWFPGARRR